MTIILKYPGDEAQRGRRLAPGSKWKGWNLNPAAWPSAGTTALHTLDYHRLLSYLSCSSVSSVRTDTLSG